MDEDTASVIQNARDLSQWAAGQVVLVDRLLTTARVRPLSPAEQSEQLVSYRELLVRVSQDRTLVEYMLERQRAGLMARAWRALVQSARRARKGKSE
jgi:uracil DNA glycosylase